jgi:DNA-directed RNA polymerase specialized sigma24 family protein
MTETAMEPEVAFADADLYQETPLRACWAFDLLDGAVRHRARLYRIATNAFLSNRWRAGREGTIDEGAKVAISDDQTDYASRIDARDLLREVAVCVDGLPAKRLSHADFEHSFHQL